MSLSVGAAYVGGASAKAASVRGQAQKIAGAADAGFTEEALAAAAGGLDASALSIARRHDPYADFGASGRDRAAQLFAARLEATKPAKSGAASATDLDCLTQAAYYEARGEGRDGMRAVAQVVLNRVRHPAYPNSVCGVVFQGSGRRIGCQFSFTCDGSMRGAVNATAWGRARTVARDALSGAKFAGVGAATHFHTTAVSPAWRGALVRVGQVGDHVFYRIGRRGEISQARPTFNVASTRERVSAPAALEAGPRPYSAEATETTPTPAPMATLTQVSTAAAPAPKTTDAPVV